MKFRHKVFTGVTSCLALAAMVSLGCAKEAESSEIKSNASAATAVTAVQPVAQSTGHEAPAPADAKSVGDKSYTLTVNAPDSVSKGTPGIVSVKVTPKSGWKMNKDFPTKLKVIPPAGVTLAKGTQKVKDAKTFNDAGAEFAFEFKADSAGDKAFKGEFKFAVCTETTCDPKKQVVAWKTSVK